MKKTYNSLEGDGPSVVTAYDSIKELENCVGLMHMPNVNRIASDLAAIAETDLEKQQFLQQWQDYACQCVQPEFDYFLDTIASADNLSHPMCCFKAARLVDPRKVNDLMPSVTDIKELGNFPFVKNSDLEKLIWSFLRTWLHQMESTTALISLNGGKDMRNFCPAGQWKHGSFFFANPRLPQLNGPFLCLRHCYMIAKS